MVGVIQDIGDVNDPAFERGAAGDGHPVRLKSKVLQEIAHVRWEAIVCRLLIDRALLALNPGHVCLAEARRRLD